MKITIKGFSVEAAAVAITVTGLDHIDTMRAARDFINRLNGLSGIEFRHSGACQRLASGKFMMIIAFSDAETDESNG